MYNIHCNSHNYISYRNLKSTDVVYSVVQCTHCHNQRQQCKKKYTIPKRHENCSFDNFCVTSTIDPSLRHSIIVLKTMLETIERKKEVSVSLSQLCDGWYMYGTTGIGKTHLSVSFLKELSILGYSSILVDFSDMLSMCHTKDRVVYDVFDEKFGQYDVICITHIGSFVYSWDRALFRNIVDYLYREQRWYICGTSYFGEGVSKTLESEFEDDSVYSKFREICVTQMYVKGIDYREYTRLYTSAY